MNRAAELTAPQLQPLVDAALREDLGRAGDLTSRAVVPRELVCGGEIVARQGGCIAGLGVAELVFRTLDPEVRWRGEVSDGASVAPSTRLAQVEGSARALLAGERVALNLLGRLSGIATATRAMVEAVEGRPAAIVCTRKTTPGLRLLEKYAVRTGGGRNHRFGLDDAILIKDNHVAIAGGVSEAIRRCRAGAGHLVKIEVEVDTLEQLDEALESGVDVVMLDNFSLEDLGTAVERAHARGVLTEASGGVTPERVTRIAASGVDLVSVGWLTHSAPSLDVGFDL